MEVEPHDHVHHHGHDHEEMSPARKAVMLGVVTIPLVGLISTIVVTWQYGFMGWFVSGHACRRLVYDRPWDNRWLSPTTDSPFIYNL